MTMIKHAESHMDHGFTQEQWDHIFKLFADREGFFNEIIGLPGNLGTVMNDLYGPSCGDPPVPEVEVFYAARGDRAWNSRMVRMPKRPTRFVRVIAGPHVDPCTGCEGKGTLPDETMHHEWIDVPCPECKGTGRGYEYACVLYTAYGVHAPDAPKSPREPGDIAKEIASRVDELRAKVEALGTEHEDCAALRSQLHKLRELRLVAEDFWGQHALASL